ncbi:MAG: aromatic ring-hydroxylating dioxygenase subunit alpha [Myxococcota bacterium]|nr:aromatic ring-hydroxylating dioxygenase subunit alpha [Myxococcota bacterium]
MKHEAQVSILKELMSQLDEGRNVDAGVMYRNPTSVYNDTELAERERETFFRDHPQLIALSGSLPGPGSYMTVDDFGVPVLATRDRDGKFRAFVNACRHRGARLAEGRGEQNRFVCPFHNWTYASDGALKTIPKHEHVGAIDKRCNGLVELPAEERGGLLWVHPRKDGVIDLDTQLAGLDEEIASWDFGELRQHGETVIEGDLNWKLANDTFGETYHFERLHRETLGQINYGDALAYEEFGRNHRFVIAARRIDALREMPESEWRLVDGTTPLYYLFPNIQLNWFSGVASLVKIYPDPKEPGKSVTRVLHYFSQEMIDKASAADTHVLTAENTYDREGAEGSEDFALTLSSLMEVFDSTVEQEDYLMGKHQQAASESGELEHLIFGRNEPALHHYHNHFRDALGMPPLEKIEPAE